MPTRITITQLEQAINTARGSQPASGSESALSAEVSLLASLYGKLIFRGQSHLDIDELAEAQRAALLRWLAPSR